MHGSKKKKKKGNYIKAESSTRHTGLTSDEGYQGIACLQMQLHSVHRVRGKFALSKISDSIRICLFIIRSARRLLYCSILLYEQQISMN